MFLTLTLPSYGTIQDGAPVDPGSYDYRRAALDAILFPRLVDQFWKTLRRCRRLRGAVLLGGGAATPPRSASACRDPGRDPAQGAAPGGGRHLSAGVVAGLRPGRLHRSSCRTGPATATADPATGELLPTWDEALDAIDNDPEARPAHVMRFGSQLDMQGLVRGQPDADRAIRYLTKYITKDVAGTHRRRPGRPAPAPCGSAASRTALAALLGTVRQLAALRHPTQSRPALVWHPASARQSRTAANTSASAAAGSWCPANGHPRPWPGIAPTGPTWSGQPWNRPGSSHPTPNACPPACKPPMVGPGSSGNRLIGMTSATPRW